MTGMMRTDPLKDAMSELRTMYPAFGTLDDSSLIRMIFFERFNQRKEEYQKTISVGSQFTSYSAVDSEQLIFSIQSRDRIVQCVRRNGELQRIEECLQ